LLDGAISKRVNNMISFVYNLWRLCPQWNKKNNANSEWTLPTSWL